MATVAARVPDDHLEQVLERILIGYFGPERGRPLPARRLSMWRGWPQEGSEFL